MSTILVVGTFAMDFIGSYPRSFSTLPEPKALNLSIQLDGLRKDFGGCAMNIAVMLHRLGQHALPFAYVGKEIDADYKRHLDALGVDERGLRPSEGDELASHALILTDPEENQFTAFYPGATKTNFESELAAFVDSLDDAVEYAVIAPDLPKYMIPAARICRERGFDFLCDPGQCTTSFSASECEDLVSATTALCFNQFEHDIFASYVADLDERLDLMIVTQGADGVRFNVAGEWHQERAAVPRERIDPTGCGDAFRAGLVHAHLSDASWRDAVRAGCVLATINLEHLGTQHHDPADFTDRYRQEWQDTPAWLGAAH